jgi:hypothetical protein
LIGFFDRKIISSKILGRKTEKDISKRRTLPKMRLNK